MLKKYTVTGTPPFFIDGEKLEPGTVIELPTQIADQPCAMGAIEPAPSDAEVAEPATPPKPDHEPAKTKTKKKA